MTNLAQYDPDIAHAIKNELERQRNGLEMIPSENFVSLAVLEAMGTVPTNKYAEGYPGKRYYGGNQFIDVMETLAIERAKKLFGAEYANVQPHAGSQANMAAYFAVMKPGEKLMGMALPMGGHLTHGHPLSFSGTFYQVVPYGVRRDGWLDMDEVRAIALREKPKVLVCGASAYPRLIDFKAFAQIAHETGAVAIADIAHVAGLVVGGAHPHPFPETDIVTTTTHKTLRGPRSALILAKAQYGAAIDKAIIPGLQGGPMEHIIAAKAVCFKEAMEPSFTDYARRIVANAKVLAETLMREGLTLVSGGTDNHLMLMDLTALNMAGKQAEALLDEVGITVNKNMIPYDPRKPLDPSGIRLGTPALTTRGFTEDDMKIVGRTIAEVLKNPTSDDTKSRAREVVRGLTEKYPLYPDLKYATY
ncbi:serine hydroxymethyltransferase [Candidatus Uhrbacteria bacterium]|nr:serine hydroxymethyltransferase [Candidatus Uhrbacteria bacterium]